MLKPSTKVINLSYWLVFVLSIFALSQFFGASKLFASGQVAQGYITAILSFLIFVFSMIYMVLQIYFEEKRKGNLQVQIKLFDYLHDKGMKL